MTKLHADLEALMPEPFAYPEGIVTGPCVCGSWPGGACLRCAPVNFFTADQVREAMQAATERAAKLADDKAGRVNSSWIAYDIAAAIRAATGDGGKTP